MKNKTLFVTACGIAASLGILSAPAYSAFVPLETFNNLTPGPLSGQHGWTLSAASENTSTVVADPFDANNLVASMTAVGTGQDTIYLSLGGNAIPNTGIATIFFRLNTTPTIDPNFNVGITDNAAPTNANFAINQSQLRLGGAAANFNTLYTRDAAAFQTIGSYTSSIWANYWLVINNTNDTTLFYTSVGNDPATLLGSASGYSFRVASANSLGTLQVIPATGASPVFMDDIYIDNSGSNLATPVVPEPSVSGLLLCLAGLGLVSRRRKAC
jgi:hypothetical protein